MITHAPITVEVYADRYEMFGPTQNFMQKFQSKRTAKLLKKMGGINEKVSPGTYTFYATLENGQIMTHLYPVTN